MAALTEVKNQVGTLVIEVAEKVLRRELGTKAEQEKHIKQLAEEVKLELVISLNSAGDQIFKLTMPNPRLAGRYAKSLIGLAIERRVRSSI